jgi:hypothetical protein
LGRGLKKDFSPDVGHASFAVKLFSFGVLKRAFGLNLSRKFLIFLIIKIIDRKSKKV